MNDLTKTTNIRKLWSSEGKEIPEEKRKMYSDPSNCLGIITKNIVMKKNFEEEKIEPKNCRKAWYSFIPKELEPQRVKIAKRFLKPALTAINKTKGKNIEIFLVKDRPILFCTEEADLLISPIVKVKKEKIMTYEKKEQTLNFFIQNLESLGLQEKDINEISKLILAKLM